MNRYRLVALVLILIAIFISTIGFIFSAYYHPRVGLIGNIRTMYIIVRNEVRGDIFDVVAQQANIDKKDLTLNMILDQIPDPQQKASFRIAVGMEALKTGKTKDEIAASKLPTDGSARFLLKPELSIKYKYVLATAIFLVLVAVFMLALNKPSGNGRG